MSTTNIVTNNYYLGGKRIDKRALQRAERVQTSNKGTLSANGRVTSRSNESIDKSFTWETIVANLLGDEPHLCIHELSSYLDSKDDCGDDWKRLARQLLDESDEKIISLEETQEERRSPTIGVLKKWVQQSEPRDATVRALVNALTVIYQTDAALSVCKFIEQPSGGPLLTWRRVVAPIVADEEKSQELAAALGIKCKASCTADGIILAWMKRDFAEATVEALLRACRKIGVFDDVQAVATRKKLTFPSLSTATEENLEPSRKRRHSSSSESKNSLAKTSASGGVEPDIN